MSPVSTAAPVSTVQPRTSPPIAPLVSVASEADAPAWDRFVSEHPQATGYHAWAWRHVFERALGHEAIYLIARGDGRGDMAGVLPLVLIDGLLFGRTLTSLPFVNYGGVVAASDEAAQALLDAASDLARTRRCRHVELRHIARQFPALPCKQHKVTMLLDLELSGWDRLDRKVRNQIRKAQKSELSVEVGGADLVDPFYAVLARNMRDLGTPVLARNVFVEVLRVFPDRARLHVIRLHGVPVAAGLSFQTHRTIEVPWASSVRDYNNLCSNHLLYWSIIEFARARGCTVLDFGRSTRGEGTYKFKEQWGARAVPLHWEYQLSSGSVVPNASPTNPKFRFAIELWRRLPLAVANRLGPPIVRTIP